MHAVDCVRVNLMNVQELYALDAHPSMAKCPSTMKHVAYGYLAICYGCSVPEEQGSMRGKSHKPRVVIDERALSFLQQHGALLWLLKVFPDLVVAKCSFHCSSSRTQRTPTRTIIGRRDGTPIQPWSILF